MACTRVSTALLFAVTAASTAFVALTDTIGTMFRTATDWLTITVVKAAQSLPRLVHQWPDDSGMKVTIVRARAFVATILHRDAPRTTPGWRLCPSI